MKRMSIALLAFFASSLAFGQANHFRSGIFLHHSTGGCIWGPNGGSTSVPEEIAKYNNANGLSGADSVTLDETGWPVTPWDNEWYRWHNIFDAQDTDAVIGPILAENKIVVIKSCFPSSGLSDAGSPSDTANPTDKTVFNYKWHWRSFIGIMSQHPGNFFVVWSNAPLVDGSTDSQSAILSDAFCRWAKDTLARGLDPVFGPFPRNVYVFDFFHKLVGADGKLQGEYAASTSDSHPNAAATELVAPQFVEEVFDAALAYEQAVADVHASVAPPRAFRLLDNYPNPFNPATTISYELAAAGRVRLQIWDLTGREVEILEDGEREAGVHAVVWNAAGRASGVYICRLEVADGRCAGGQMTQAKGMILLK